MDRVMRAALCALLLAAGETAGAQCTISPTGEYLNPSQACLSQQLRFVQHATGDVNDIPLGYAVPEPVDSLTPVAGFRSYAFLHAQHQDLLAANTTTVTGETVGTTTVAGRPIWAYRLGTAGDTTIYGQRKGAVMAVAGTHAREWQPPEAVTELFERLVAGSDDEGIGQYLAENLIVVLIPVLNVDGFLLTQQNWNATTAHPQVPRDGRMRRKNLRNSDTNGVVDTDLSTTGDNLLGVDLNRNHPDGFRSVAANSSPNSLIYAGPSPHSEPEVDALLDAVAIAPGDRLRLYMDVHSFSQIYFTPQTDNANRNALTLELASRMRAVTNNRYRYSPDPVNAAIGTSADYMAWRYQIPSWTLETEPLNGGQDYPGGTGASHSGFITPDSEIDRLRDEIARTSLLGFYHQAGPPSIVAAEIRDEDGDVVWSVDWEAGATGTRTLAVHTDGALEAGGTYTAWIAFDKPMRWRGTGGNVTQYAGQTARLQPTLTLEVADGTTNREFALSGGDWLDAPGPGPDGFLNYKDDAFAVTFTLPADLPTTATAALLVVDADDMTGQQLDADPASAVDWANGGWVGYQDTAPDCELRVWVGATGTSNTLACNAATTPPPPPPPANSGGGGRLGFAWWLVLALSAMARGYRREPCL